MSVPVEPTSAGGAATPPPEAEQEPRPRCRTGIAAGLVAMATVAAVGAAAVGHEPLLREAGLRGQSLPPAASTLFPSPTQLPSPAGAHAGIVPAPGMPQPSVPIDKEKLAARLRAIPQKHGGTSGAMVLDAASGQQLYRSNHETLFIPASNMKTLTVLGVLHALGSHAQFTTAVTSPAPGRLVLRGGGDPYLRSVPDPGHPDLASLEVLAQRTAEALKQQGRTSVGLGYDASLFVGPDWAPTWPAGYRDQVTPVQALMVDGGRGRIKPDGTVEDPARTATPALTAAQLFAEKLKGHGITVTGAISAAPAGTGAPIAQVQSAPLDQLVTMAMVASDNTATEMLLRQLAIARKQPASFVGGTTALRAELEALQVWHPGAQLHDGSGLSRSNRVTPTMLAKAWTTVVGDESLHSLLVATPVAGVTGTLRDRFLIDEARDGRGRVHAKTGTLSEVSSLSGWTVTASGQSVIVVMLVNGSKNDWWARAWIDQFASTVSGCGC